MVDRDYQIYLIAEVGQAHEGSLGIAHSYIDALAETGSRWPRPETTSATMGRFSGVSPKEKQRALRGKTLEKE